jgi:allantoin racemase
VTTLGRTTGRARELARAYGFAEACLGVHACEIPVLDLETDPNAARVVTEHCARALESDGSDVVVLGCAGMADLCQSISAEIGAPVVDGVAAATVFVQGLVTLGLATARRGEWAPPSAKRYTGSLASFTVPA